MDVDLLVGESMSGGGGATYGGPTDRGMILGTGIGHEGGLAGGSATGTNKGSTAGVKPHTILHVGASTPTQSASH